MKFPWNWFSWLSNLKKGFASSHKKRKFNFTPRFLEVMALAKREAIRLKHDSIGTEHLLLGYIALEKEKGIGVLTRLGLNLDIILREIEKKAPMRSALLPDKLTYSVGVKKALALAARESRKLSHSYIDLGHGLIGLISEGNGIAAQILISNVDIVRVREEASKVPSFED